MEIEDYLLTFTIKFSMMKHMSERAQIFIAIVAYLALVFFLILRKRVEVKTNRLFLFRALFPSWRFFEESGTQPVLFQRLSEGSWEPVFLPLKRQARTLFFNPEGNERLAHHSLLQVLVKEMEDAHTENELSKIESSVSYLLIKNLVAEKSKGRAFQFKITQRDSLSREPDHDVLTSPLYPGNSAS